MSEDRDLGLDRRITRKDFLNASLLGAGGALLWAAAPAARVLEAGFYDQSAATNDDWTGYGGVGDYASSNGNTKPVMDVAHRLRDGAFASVDNAVDTGELVDVIIVGGGIAGLMAAYRVAKATERRRTCLVLENHPIFGGGARQNEFVVEGQRLVGPQASNQFGVPRGSASLSAETWTDFNLPRSFEYQPLHPSVEHLSVPLDNYAHMDGVNEQQVDVGYYFDERSGASTPMWTRNMWRNGLTDTPFSPDVRADLLRWRSTEGPSGPDARRQLDGMSYAQYLEGELGLRPEVTALAAPIIGLISGASPDAIAASAAAQIGMPAVGRVRSQTGPLPQSFPGGNATLARHFVKHLVPDGISGPNTFDGVHTGRMDAAALDRAGQAVRIRLGATVVRVEHAQSPTHGEHVSVVYEKDGRLYRSRARAAVMASGGMMTRHVLADMPAAMRAAYDEFLHAPALVVNVALTNWRFLRELSAPCCRWFSDDFGFSCNIRRTMVVGEPLPPLNPDRPTVLTFYMGLHSAGVPIAEQLQRGRQRLLETSFADYERQLRRHMTRLFADVGFEARRDIAGVILNRWGHARLVQPPGFYYGRDGQTPAREVVGAGYGRISIGHSELNGHQSATGAMATGNRAAEQALAAI